MFGWLSPYLIAVIAGWVIAQGLKYIIESIKERRAENARHLYFSGGMPSAHSSTTVALLVVIGALNGAASPLFAIMALVTAITMYDAVMVRRSSGEQGASLTALIKEQNSQVRLPRVAKGHTPLEVLVGALVGAIIGLIVVLFTN